MMRNVFRKMRKEEKGFTLIELIVVIAILAILAAIAIPRLAGFTDSAKAKADLATATTIGHAISAAYAADTDTSTTAEYDSVADLKTLALIPQNISDTSQSAGAWIITVGTNGDVKITGTSPATVFFNSGS